MSYLQDIRRMSAPAVAVMVLAGCATPRNETLKDERDVLIVPHVHFLVSDPDALAPSPADVDQLIVAEYAGRKLSFETRLQVRSGQIDIVATDAFGRRLVTIQWTKSGITYKNGVGLPAIIPPLEIIANLEMVFASDEVLSGALRGTGASFVNIANRRALKVDGIDAVVIDFESGNAWNRVVHLNNIGFGYRMDVNSVQAAAQPRGN